jgi:hypothetical protein
MGVAGKWLVAELVIEFAEFDFPSAVGEGSA